jgi:hypothetical protein
LQSTKACAESWEIYSSTVLAEISSISVKPKDKLEGASNFNVWKARVLNILEEYDLDNFVTSTVEEPTSNARRTGFKKKQQGNLTRRKMGLNAEYSSEYRRMSGQIFQECLNQV